MAGLWPARKDAVCTDRRRVLPLCGRAPVRALSSGHPGSGSMVVRGSARCTGSSGLGDTAVSIPAGGGTVREANSASRTTRWPRVVRGVHGACTRLSPHR
ncbi:hypothetical protein GCM10010524_36430 [Streptomyces mexicanus]